MNNITSSTVNNLPNSNVARLMRLLRSPWLRGLLALVYTGVLVVYLLQPHSQPVIAKPSIPGQARLSREILRTFGHFVTFGGLTLVWVSALSAVMPFRRALLLTAASMVFFGILSEWAQSRVPERSASIEDLSADILGMMLAVGVAMGVRWLWQWSGKRVVAPKIETLG